MPGYTIRNQEALHFLTFTVVGWVDAFTRKKHCDILLESLRYCRKDRGLLIGAYVIMSNHMHLIVRSNGQEKLSNIIRDFKKYTANRILKSIQSDSKGRKDWMLHIFSYYASRNTNNRNYQFWTQYNHPIELLTPKWIHQKMDYIHLNPVKAGLVKEPQHYLYSSASNYYSGEGLIDIDIIDLGSTIGYIDL